MNTHWTPDHGTLDRSAPIWAPKRPIRIALLGDFSAGAARGRLDTGADLARRKPIPVEFDTLEDALARLDVKLSLSLGDNSLAELDITELESFHADELYRSLELFSQLAGLRKQLNNTATFAKAAAQVQAWAGQGGARASQSNRKRKARGSTPAIDARLSDFARLVGTAEADKADGAVDSLVRRIVGPFVVPAASPQKDKLTASVDAALSDAMRTVLHHPDFQTLESLWRGVDFLLRRLETGPGLQVHLIDISAEELAADLSGATDLAETGLYQLLVDTPSQDKTGGYTLLCGLYQFEATPPHTELLGRMARIAQHASAPFLTGMAIDSLCDRKRPPHALVQEALKALQQLPEASHLGLLGPRFMLRHPYGKRTDPISSFDFEEFSASEGLSGMLWGHPALLAACALAGPGGTTIGDLPFHHFKDADGDTHALPCTERLINTDTATSLRSWGITALMAHKGAPELRLTGLDAVNGETLGKVSPTGAKPRAGIDTRISVGGALNVSVTAKKPVGGSAALAGAGASDADTASDSGLDIDFGLDSSGSGDSSTDTSGDDLDALLASLGGDSDSSTENSDDASSTAAPDDEMDPDLAALLASLG